MRIIDIRIDTCPSTFILDKLNRQIIAEFNTIAPGKLVRFDDLDVKLGQAAYPFVGGQTAKARLKDAIESRGKTLVVNSALRTVAQQFLLWRMHHFAPGRCGIAAVAEPGSSNHESGLALDVQDPFSWRLFMSAKGWKHLGAFDPPHFDFLGGTDLRKFNVMAFQSLWNKHNPGDPIKVDGWWGDQTKKRLELSPVDGF